MATSVVFPRVQFFANNGRPLIGGRIHTFVAGSSTRATTYKDAAKAQPNTNPIILDGRGEASVYLAEGVEYKFVIEDSRGALIMTQEPVYGAVWPNASDWPSDATLSYRYMVEARAAASAVGPIDFYGTYAQAMANVANIPDDGLIEVSYDVNQGGARTRYFKRAGGVLEFAVNLDQVRLDLADPAHGSRLVKTPNGDLLSDAVPWITPFAKGAKADGVFNDGPAEAAAHESANGKAVFYPPGNWNGIAPARNIYGALYQDALRGRYVAGRENIPIASPAPVIWSTQYTSANRATNPSEWDSGAVYGALIKVSGDAFGAGITGAVRHNGGSGHLVGGHFRGEARHADAEAWGGWSYGAVSGAAATVNGGSGAKSVIAHEFNINNQGPDVGWNAGAVVGSARGIVITTVDGGGNAQVGMSLGSGAGETGKWWTGIHLRGNSFGVAAESLDQVGNGEAFRLDGSTLANATGAIRFYGGNFRYGISFAESGFSSNCAILLSDNQRIVVGTGPNSTRYLGFNRSDGWVNFNNLLLRINGTQVLGTQKPAIANVAEVTASACVVTINHILNTMRSHGLIAT